MTAIAREEWRAGRGRTAADAVLRDGIDGVRARPSLGTGGDGVEWGVEVFVGTVETVAVGESGSAFRRHVVFAPVTSSERGRVVHAGHVASGDRRARRKDR